MKALLLLILQLPLVVNAQCLSNQTEWENYFKSNINGLDPIEGIWSVSFTQKFYRWDSLVSISQVPQAMVVAVFRKDNNFLVCRADISVTTKTPRSGSEVFLNTAAPGVYLYRRHYKKSNSTAKSNATLTDGALLEFSAKLPDEQLRLESGEYHDPARSFVYEDQWVKLFPSDINYNSPSPSSGTGFAISSEGYILTNHHVVNGASNITVKGVNGNFENAFRAKVVSKDVNNDLALLKIDDKTFTGLGTPPYTISKTSSDVGISVFVLGYPLRATMGDEIKLTNGIVSAKSGFQGDITSYQLSAPIQPGNSGAPVFDKDGNVVAIINAKHVGAENVSYAIKINYLSNLIDFLDSRPKLPATNSLAGKTLSEQVKNAKGYVYIIEVE